MADREEPQGRARRIINIAEAFIDDIRTTLFGGNPNPLARPVQDTARARTTDDSPFNQFPRRQAQRLDDVQEFNSSNARRRNRRRQYELYRECEDTIPEISQALKIYADYTATGSAVERADKTSNVYSVRFAEETEVGQRMIDEINTRLTLPDLAHDIVHHFVWLGDDFIEMVYQEVGISRIQRLPPETMFRNVTEDGRLAPVRAFTQVSSRRNQETHFHPFQIAHFRAATDLDPGYGKSLLKSMTTVCREINLIETALTVARLTKAHRRIIYGIDVGSAQGVAAEKAVDVYRNRYRKQRIIDRHTGQIDIDRNIELEEEDIFMATGKERVSSITQLPGDPSLAQIADVLHKYERLLAGVRIPIAWLGLTGPNIRNVIDEQVKSFMRSARMFRSFFERGATEIYLNGMISMGASPEFMRQQSLLYTWPTMTHADDEAHLNLMMLRAKVMQEYQGIFPKEMSLLRIIGLSEEEAQDVMRRLEEEAEQGLQRMVARQAALGQQDQARDVQRQIEKLKEAEKRQRILDFRDDDMAARIEQMAIERPDVAQDLQELRSSILDVLGVVERKSDLGIVMQQNNLNQAFSSGLNGRIRI